MFCLSFSLWNSTLFKDNHMRHFLFFKSKTASTSPLALPSWYQLKFEVFDGFWKSVDMRWQWLNEYWQKNLMAYLRKSCDDLRLSLFSINYQVLAFGAWICSKCLRPQNFPPSFIHKNFKKISEKAFLTIFSYWNTVICGLRIWKRKMERVNYENLSDSFRPKFVPLLLLLSEGRAVGLLLSLS